MKKSKILSAILLLTLLSALVLPGRAAALSDPAPSVKAAVVADTATGNVLYAKNGDGQVYPASTTKIMTVLLAVEAIEDDKVSLTDEVTAGSGIMAGLTEDGSTAGIVPGETMTLEDLLYCAMLSSANEACNIIAEHIGGDVATFVGMMNARASALGCTGTHFTNTHGLPDYNHYTTANDLAKIALEAYTHPLFMEICNTVTKTIPATNITGERQLSSTNGLINKDSELYTGYYYEYAKGIKTGHTQDAGYCLVSSAAKDGVSLLCVVMGGLAINRVEKIEYTNFTDSVKLYDWAFENFSYRDILETKDLIRDIPVAMGRDADEVTVRPETAVQALMAIDEDNSGFEQTVRIYSEERGEKLVAPIEAGTVLGEISISRDGKVYGSSKLVANNSIDVSYSQLMKAKIAQTLKNPLVIVFIVVVLGLLAGYVYLVIRYRRSKQQYLRQMEARRAEKASVVVERQAAKEKLRARAGTVRDAPEDDGGGGTGSAYIPEETQAERDYFDEFFGRNKK